MRIDPWLPVGYELQDGSSCKRLRAAGESWQIYDANDDGSLMFASKELVDRWLAENLVSESRFSPLEFAGKELCYLHSGTGYAVASVGDPSSAPNSKPDAMTFAAALQQTRKINVDVPLHDAIYIEEISRLLPTYSVSAPLTDDMVLGTWLAGGIQVSALSGRRISTLLSWMGGENVGDILSRAGIQSEGGELTRTADDDDIDDAEESTTRSRRKKKDGGSSRRGKSGEFNLPGRPDIERLFNEHVIEIVRDPDRYKTFGIEFPTAIALHGPPGCGKTYAVDQLVEFLDWPIFTIDPKSIGSPYIHETSKKVAEIFDKAIDAAPSVIVIDEMESYLASREGAGAGGSHRVEEVAEFLRRIPEANENRVLVIGMTNRIDMIDPAILRRGRFDHIVEVRMPSVQEVDAALKEMIGEIPTDDNVDTLPLAEKLQGQPMSDAAYVVREAGRNAARAGKNSLDQESLIAALDAVPSRVEEKTPKPIGFIWEE